MNGNSGRQRLCEISKVAFQAVANLLDQDQSLARQLRSEETGSRQFHREESITGSMAAAIVDRFPENVQMTLFTPHEESRTGADWYWRIESGGRALHAMVQAKRVQRGAFGQRDEDGQIEINSDQLATLVQRVEQSQQQLPGLQAWLASFVRMMAVPPPCKCDNLNQCHYHRHREPCEAAEPSIWIAHASEFQHRAGLLPVLNVVAESLRLDCLLPCVELAALGSGPAVKRFRLAGDAITYEVAVSRIRQSEELRMSFEGAIGIAV